MGEASALPRVDALLTAHGLVRVGEPQPIADSVLNENFRVESASSPLFVRIYRPGRTPEQLRNELAIMRWVSSRGVPVNQPLEGPGGPFEEIQGRLAALFPWLDGYTTDRDATRPAEAATLGATHGRVQAALTAYSGVLLHRPTGPAWETERSHATLTRILAAIDAHESWPAEFATTRADIVRQLRLLESGIARPHADFGVLLRQPVHGDFHNRNVMLKHVSEVQAVIDWELAQEMPRVFELLRSMSFSFGAQDEPLRHYLRGYRHHVVLAPEECELGVEMWWQHLLHGTWAYGAVFLESDPRPARFFEGVAADIEQFRDPAYRARLATILRGG